MYYQEFLSFYSARAKLYAWASGGEEGICAPGFWEYFNKYSYYHNENLGASIKYVTLEGGRGSKKVWQFVTGRGGQEHVTSCL